MTQKNILLGAMLILLIGIAVLFSRSPYEKPPVVVPPLDPTPYNVTLTGTYVCLPHLDTTGPQTEECAFGIQAESGEFYAVNFGQSATAMEQFQSGSRVTAEGFVVIKEALSTDQWAKYNMKGIFTVTKILEAVTPPQAKLNIDVVCQGALAYMTFADGKSANAFVAECKAGNHPEVIERYKKEIGVGDGAQI